jgi:hypothetical protein
VLLKFLANESDEAIANSLHITKATVRKTFEKICEQFGLKNDFPDERRSKRQDLVALFAKYKPELLGGCASVVENEGAIANPNAPVSQADESDLDALVEKVRSHSTDFLGREEAIADLNNLVNKGEKVILIQEEGGIGKTTLAEKYFKTQGFDLVLELYMGKETENIKPVEGRIEQWLRKFQDEPGRDFDTTLDKLREHLRDGSRKIGVLIDNLEPALKNGLFRDASWRYADLLRMLASVQSVTLITSREPLYEPGIRAELYQLKELKEEDWKQYFDSYDIKTGSPALGEMHHAYGGNAEVMYIFKGAIKDKKFKGDLEAYWEHNREDLLRNPTLKNLVKRQFFKLQEDNEPAHKLLCRLGYYRYQNFPCIPRTGLLCLLGDIEDKRAKERIIDDLEDCSLVKIRDEGYYLHPVIRE